MRRVLWSPTSYGPTRLPSENLNSRQITNAVGGRITEPRIHISRATCHCGATLYRRGYWHGSYVLNIIGELGPGLTGCRDIFAVTHARPITPLRPWGLPLNTYVVSIGGQAVLAFRAEDDDQAREMIDDHEGNVLSDLKTLADTDGKPLWDGKTAIHVREANATQHAEWEQSRD